MNHAQTADYLAAIEAIQADMKAGHIRAYATGYSKTRGRYIEIQTDQGWNPDPVWQEIEPEPYLGNDDRTDLFI